MARLRAAISHPAIFAFLALQVALPAFLLTAPGNRRFGWQMFATSFDIPTVVRETVGGADSIPLRSLVGFVRADLDLDARAARQICSVPGTQAVSISAHQGHPDARYPCGE